MCGRYGNGAISLSKHDFSTFDLLGRWGFEMNSRLTEEGWHFHDQSLTTAEIIRKLYIAIREAAGDAILIGCNTIGHLAAGLVEVQRIGDDTSGREWSRTRKMGVNTLAFRLPQHETFFLADADCVPVTNEIPWELPGSGSIWSREAEPHCSFRSIRRRCCRNRR